MNDVQKQSASGLAIAALVTGILQMGIVPIILGAIDLGKIKNNLFFKKIITMGYN